MSLKAFETLIPDVQKLLDGHDLSKSVQQFSDKLGAMVVNRFQRHGEERLPKLYLSNVGKPLRQLWYDLNGFKGEPLTPETKFKFLYGDVIEELFLFLAVEAGHEVTDLQKRIEFDGVPGKIDAVIDGVLVDVKSCSTRSWEKFKNKTLFSDDPFGYVAQLTGYRDALKIQRAAFIAIDKTMGKICTLELDSGSDFDLSAKIGAVRKALDSKSEPARCYAPVPVSKNDKSGNLVLGTGCSYCGHKDFCWRDSNGGKGLQKFFYSSGPKWFVHVAKTPRLDYLKADYDTFPIKEKAQA